MANSPLHPNPSNNPGNTGLRPDRRSPPSTPRWVKAAAILGIVLILMFVIVHLTGGGFGHHAPLIQHRVQLP